MSGTVREELSGMPNGIVTFLFTDIVGSSRLWERFPSDMGAALARHDAIIREAVQRNSGYIFKTVGDSFCIAFHTPGSAIRAAIEAQKALAAENWGAVGTIHVRMGVHAGAAEVRDNDYFGGALNRCARIEAAAHGGQILLSRRTVELLQDEPLEGVAFKPLGAHRLRNLERPEYLCQIVTEGLSADFPPPRSMEILPNNLPVQANSFIGREKEIRDIRRLLTQTRLLTLSGTGGTGKTRLALEIGAQLIQDFPDGVWLVELAPISQGERIAEAIASSMGVREEPGRPLRETLLHFFKSRDLLLILDNCEHLASDAASLVNGLLHAAPRLKIIATSRHSLGIAGETAYPVPPLSMLDLDLEELRGEDIVEKLSQYEAVRLFIARAVAVRPDFTVTNANAPAVAEICSRLDGIPLAIELAAARVRLLSVEQIAERLENRFQLLRGGSPSALPHQQTLQALIDWSYDLLSEAERVLFRRLSVFAGGRTLEAIEAVCATSEEEKFEILDTLQQLVEKSLVTVERGAADQPRYTLIESVWQYAREKLRDSGEWNQLRDRHLDYFRDFAEDCGRHLQGPEQSKWLEIFHLEQFNFHHAVEWAIESGRIEDGLRIFASLERALEIRGDLTMASEMAQQLLQQTGENTSPATRARALNAAARLAWTMDRYKEARQFYIEAEALYREIGDEVSAAFTSTIRAFIEWNEGHIEDAERRFREGLEAGRKFNHPVMTAAALSGLGNIAMEQGRPDEALRLKEEGLAIYRRLGDHWVIGLILWGIARVALEQGDIARGRTAILEWLEIARALRNRWVLSYIFEIAAEAFLADGKPEQAARLLGAAEAARERFGMRLSASEERHHERTMSRLRDMLEENLLNTWWQEGRQLEGWDALEEVMI